MNHFLLFVLFILGFVASPCSAEIDFGQLDTTLQSLQEKNKVVGLAVGAVVDGRLVYARYFGFQNATVKTPLSRESVFHAASLSKVFTTAAILKLQDEGRLSIDQDASRYLPALTGKGITLRHLLTHTSGLPAKPVPTGTLQSSGIPAYLRQVAASRPTFAPGQDWEYSDTGFNVLGAIISQVTGQDYPAYLRDSVLQPLSMNHSSFYLPDIPPGHVARPHGGFLGPRLLTDHPYDRVFAPSSGLQTTVEDLARFAAACLASSDAGGSPWLSAESRALWWQPQRATKWPGVTIGLGWQLTRQEGKLIAMHSGSDDGYKSRLTLYPDENLAVIILANSEKVPRAELTDAIRAAFQRH